MGKINHIHDAEDKGQADPDQRIGAADDQAVHDILKENHMQLGRRYSQLNIIKQQKNSHKKRIFLNCQVEPPHPSP
jgi:hypothetical protein